MPDVTLIASRAALGYALPRLSESSGESNFRRLPGTEARREEHYFAEDGSSPVTRRISMFRLAMRITQPWSRGLLLAICIYSVFKIHSAVLAQGTLLFSNLAKLQQSFRVDDPSVAGEGSSTDGPKGLAAADLNADGYPDLVAANSDGTIAVIFGRPGGGFDPVQHIKAGDARGLRDVIVADINQDGRPDVVAAHPFEGKLYVLSVAGGPGSRSFSAPRTVTTWPGARSVAAGDFDGDGKVDLAVGGAGGGLREYRRNDLDDFIQVGAVTEVNPGPYELDSAKPVFSMHVWRRPGESRDSLVVTHADALSVWFLRSPGIGQALSLDIANTPSVPLLDNEAVYDLVVGFFSAESRSSGQPDILTASTYLGQLFVRSHPYKTLPTQRIPVPGGPRALTVSDVNGDGWPDLLVASRSGNSLSLFLNQDGSLDLSSIVAAGGSPRDVVSVDFDRNGLPDAAVINRESADITVHLVDPGSGSFFQSQLLQSVVGAGSNPFILDIDGNGREELVYVTSATGEVNIQNLGPDGLWLSPMHYFMGAHPQSLDILDMDGDGKLDLVCTSLPEPDGAHGDVSYRRQTANSTFGELVTVATPSTLGGRIFGLVAKDLNGDGRTDLIVGYRDNIVAFFEGTPTGLVHRRTEPSIDETSAMLLLDLDRDGDFDLVALSAYGGLAVVENNRQWFTGGPYRLKTITPPGGPSGAFSMTSTDRNGDGYPDLTVNSLTSLILWNGAPGLTFTHVDTIVTVPNVSQTEIDFDGDGIRDRIALDEKRTTVSFYKSWSAGAATIQPIHNSVPSIDFLASGDLDGDGKPDLVGVGQYLWAALSGTPAPPQVPVAFTLPVPEMAGVVINEILADPGDYVAPQVAPSTRSPHNEDCIEIFNGSGDPVNLTNWKLLRESATGESADFVFPSGLILQPRGFVVVYCSEKSSPMQATFKLPAKGCTLRLITAEGQLADSVIFAAQQPGIAYARLFDGSRSFVFSPFPGMGSRNYDNGSVKPRVEFKGFDYAVLRANQWRFRAKAWSPNGIITLSVFWRRISTGLTPVGTIPLFDDGKHDDGASLDGVFAGDWDNPLPLGSAIEFFLTVTDYRWRRSTIPNDPYFTSTGAPIRNYTMALPTISTGWEISEVVSRNESLTDESGVETPDWTELRYTGATEVAVKDLFLSDSLFGYNITNLYDISRIGSSVLPGTKRIVYLDGTDFDAAKPRHAPFSVDGEERDSVYLLRRLPTGATEFVDAVSVPPLPPDTAYARLGVGGPFVETIPTPNGPNAPAGGILKLSPGNGGGIDCLFAFPGGGSIEASNDLESWTRVQPWISNNGIERTYQEHIDGTQRFYRIR